MFPTLGRLTMVNDPGVAEDDLIYCDWCRWKDIFNGITASHYKQKQWVAIPDVDITVTANDKKKSALYITPYLADQLEEINKEDHGEFWADLSLILKEGFNNEDVLILQEYVKTKDPKQLTRFKSSIQKGVADICPACLGEAITAFPHCFTQISSNV